MSVVELNGLRIVNNSSLVVLQLPVSKASVMIKVSFRFIQFNGSCEVLNGLLEVALSVFTDSSVVKSKGIIWFSLKSFRVILDRLVVLAQLVVGEASIKQRFEVVWLQLDGFGVELQCQLEVSGFSCLVALAVERFSLLVFDRLPSWLALLCFSVGFFASLLLLLLGLLLEVLCQRNF